MEYHQNKGDLKKSPFSSRYDKPIMYGLIRKLDYFNN